MERSVASELPDKVSLEQVTHQFRRPTQFSVSFITAVALGFWLLFCYAWTFQMLMTLIVTVNIWRLWAIRWAVPIKKQRHVYWSKWLESLSAIYERDVRNDTHTAVKPAWILQTDSVSVQQLVIIKNDGDVSVTDVRLSVTLSLSFVHTLGCITLGVWEAECNYALIGCLSPLGKEQFRFESPALLTVAKQDKLI